MDMQSDIRTGTDDFSKLLLNSTVFVDKSLFIKEFLLSSGEVLLITRPRRWGKSLNMNMLSRFLAIEVDKDGKPIPQEQSLNRKLFLGGEVTIGDDEKKQLSSLKIAAEEKIVKRYLGKFPVITLGLKDVKGDSYDKTLKKLKKALAELFGKHAYLLSTNTMLKYEQDLFDEYLQAKSDEVNTQDSLYFLSKLLRRYFKKPVYILVDEYDTPINNAYLKFKSKNPDTFDRIVELFRDLLGKALKGNENLQRGLVTGILRLAKANIFSDWNNVSEYTLLDKRFATAYGFTQAEVDVLLDIVPISTTREQIRHWYNGYNFGGATIYNPWSIMSCLSNEGTLDHYWIDSGGDALVDAILLNDRVQENLQRLTRGEKLRRIVKKKIVFNTLDKPDSIYDLLLFSGYLNPEVVDSVYRIYHLSVPNYEVQYIYQERILAWVEAKLRVSSEEYLDLSQMLVEGDTAAFRDALQGFLNQATSFYQVGSKMAEIFYSGFMSCLLSTLHTSYRMETEYESGTGRADVILIPKPTSTQQALVLEYKVCEDPKQLLPTAQAGLNQVLSKDYAAKVRLHEHVQKVLAVSLAFCGKKVALEASAASV
ncbi:MAG: AAA family ATPase [Bacteroidota bacterium]